jgi:2-methylisocitrate lyase-like PEP mutase family enzyme
LNRGSLRQALAAERPLVTPLAHDALSARLIEQAGFNAFAIGGSALLAARHALPDIGLIGLRDMVEGIRDIASASALPFLADGDDGYGDAKSVVRTVLAYEELGVGGILIEDQVRDRKQQRADRAAAVVDEIIIEGKLKAALAARRDAETLIIGRTDAYGALGLDAALRRAERFMQLGVDGVFVAGLRAIEDYERVGRALAGAVLSAAMFEGADTPWITPQELGALGFGHVSFPVSVLFRSAVAMRDALADLRRYADEGAPMTPMPDAAAARQILDSAVGLARWRQVESAYSEAGA